MAAVDQDVLTTEQKRKQNRWMNIYDPPKDLKEYKTPAAKLPGAGGLEDKQLNKLCAILQETFFPTGTEPQPEGTFNPVTDKKDLVVTKVKEVFGAGAEDLANKLNALRILRSKSSTGHDPKPDELYVSQDAGSKEVTTNPKFIITPGVILDSASKTKENDPRAVVYYLARDWAECRTLERDTYITPLNLENVISDNITMSYDADTYTISIPTNIAAGADGILSASFDSNFVPNSAYFKGNEVKNTFIKGAIPTEDTAVTNENKKKIKFYLLGKEIGDTLQVMWINKLVSLSTGANGFLKDEVLHKFTKGNTVVTTNDTIVWLRCLINGVPVIISINGVSHYYRALGSEYREIAIQAFILGIRKEVSTHNFSVVDTIKKVILNERSDAMKAWVNQASWGDEAFANAKAYLTDLAAKLENVAKDLDFQIKTQTTIEDAQRLASKAHFNNPFSYVKNGGYYKTNNSVVSITTGVSFKARQFVASNFTTSIVTNTPPRPAARKFSGFFTRGGTRKLQRGGKASRRAAARIQANTDANVNTILVWAVSGHFGQANGAESINEVRDGVVDGKVTAELAENYSDSPVSFEDISYLWNTWISNGNNLVNVGSAANALKKPFFLFLFLRDYIPQIFAYANVVRTAFELIRNEANELANKAENHTLPSGKRITRGDIEQANALKAKCQRNVDRFPDATLALKHLYNEVTYYTVNDHSVDKKFKIFYEDLDLPDVIPASAEWAHIKTAADDALKCSLQVITLASYLRQEFPYLCKGDLELFLRYFDSNLATRKLTIEMLSEDEKKLFDEIYTSIFDERTFEERLAQEGGGTVKKILDPVAFVAMDNYELYYSLAVQATYQNREVTDAEFAKALEKVREIMRLEILRSTPKKSSSTSATYDPFALAKLLKGSRVTGRNNTTSYRVANVPQFVRVGGKRKYRKTQKKRKQGRKTRKGRGKK